jgi:hypothetical protein
MIDEVIICLAVIDTEVQLSRIRLAIGYTVVIIDAEIETASVSGVVKTNYVSEGITEVFVDIDCKS